MDKAARGFERIVNPGLAAMGAILSSTKRSPVRAPIPRFSGFYRIVEPKCRIVRVFPVCSGADFTSECAVFFMGEYRRVPGLDRAGGWGSA